MNIKKRQTKDVFVLIMNETSGKNVCECRLDLQIIFIHSANSSSGERVLLSWATCLCYYKTIYTC